jgi:2-desacetyl-2-hydroxyethyl bacteriochlorophyllide A dehydrogenase
MIPDSMRAARFYGPGQPLRLENAPIPTPGTGEALLRVRAAGVCHTELHMLDGVLNLGVIPLTPGHEVVGEVVRINGPSALQSGQRVLLYYYAPCGACAYCRSGAENLCPNAARQIGFTADGGYAEYLVAPVRSLLPLPDALSDAEAVGLACGAATALHAARAVAGIKLGETAVVYGVGGVGFYLVQLCRLACARVLAIGRSPEKLRIATELGADRCINARDDDPFSAVYDSTGGDGADVVFDLVASDESMALATRMLARHGRLIFTGYGADKLQLSPLWLVLREVQIRGAVGNTLAELHEVIHLAECGRLRSVTGPAFALEEANDALAALRAGTLLGRAMLVPRAADRASLSEPERRLAREPAPSPASTALAAPAQQDRTAVPPRPFTGKKQDGHPHRPQPQPLPHYTPALPRTGGRQERGKARPLEAGILALIGRGVQTPCPDDEFNDLALRLFAFQFSRNEPFRKFCTYRGDTPASIHHWTAIPAVPIGAFKETALVTSPVEEAVAVFMSSGTTRPEQRSRHYHPDLTVYDASARTNFAAHLLPDGASLPMLVLNPPPDALPHSSLAHYLGLMVQAYGAPGGGYFVDEHGLASDRLMATLRAAQGDGQPVCLLGTTFAFVHLLDWMAQHEEPLALPNGSRVMDTGGVKGRSREITREELRICIAERLGVPFSHQVNMYGLTELSTQFLDGTMRLGADAKTVPPWARTRVLDPETLRPIPDGEVGVLCHTDLANRASVCTILTEDLGVRCGDGFEVLGRVAGSQARGCSIAMDELLAATGRSA